MADRQFDYMLLDRLKRDCDYFLGACAEAAARGDSTVVGAERHLWAGSVESQIAKMRELFDMVPEKPEWLTEEDIDRYETAMRGLRDKGVDLRTGARAGSWKDRLVVIDTVEARLLGGETRTDALLFNPGNDHTPFIVAQGYDPATRSWSSGRYMHDLMDALCDLRGCTHPDFAITGMTPERIMAEYVKGYEISPEQACEVAEDINDRLENAVVWELDVIDVEWYLGEHDVERRILPEPVSGRDLHDILAQLDAGDGLDLDAEALDARGASGCMDGRDAYERAEQAR